MFHKKKGQALTEYLILVALIAVASIGVIQVMSKNLRTRLGRVASTIGGREGSKKTFETQDVKEVHTNLKDLGNFDSGTDNSVR